MSIGEIFSDAIKYPFNDITKFVIVGVIALIASLTSVIASFGVDSSAITAIASIISLIFSIVLLGYGISVIKKGIENSDEIPDIDFRKNITDGIKAIIIEIVYFIIPIIIAVLVLGVGGLVGAGLDHVVMGLGLSGLVVVIIFIIFAIFETVAIARFADTDDLGAALSIGEVIADVQRIGILNIILFVIVAFIIIFIASLITGLIGQIPYVGVIIASILIGAFIVLFYHKALGLLYA